MKLTTVAHHLSLLVLPSELAHALKAGRCTSPRALHELAKLHEQDPAPCWPVAARSAARRSLRCARCKLQGRRRPDPRQVRASSGQVDIVRGAARLTRADEPGALNRTYGSDRSWPGPPNSTDSRGAFPMLMSASGVEAAEA